MEFYSPSEKIKQMRKQFRVNQSELECANMTRAYISMMESGRRNVSKGSSRLLAERFNNIAKRIHLDLNLDDEFFSRKPHEDARHYCEGKIKKVDELDHKKLDELIKIERKFNLDDLLAYTLKIKGEMYNDNNEYSKAFECLSNSLGVYKELRNDKEQIKVYMPLGFCKYRKGNYEDAIFYYKNAMIYSLEYKDIVSYMRASKTVALCYAQMREYEKCISIIDDNILSSKEEVSEALAISVKAIKAGALFNLGRGDEAVKQYFELVDLVKDNDQPTLSLLYNNIAEYYYSIKDYDKSLFFISKSQAIKVKCDKGAIASTLNMKAKVMFEKGLQDESFMLFDLAIDMAEEYRRYDLLLESYRDLAHTLKDDIYLGKVKERMLRLLHLLETNDIEEGRGFALYNLAEISTREGNREEAIKYFGLLRPMM